MKARGSCLTISAALILWAAPAFAQVPPEKSAPEAAPRPQEQRSDPKACAPRPGTSGAPLSDKLAKTDGVICPPAGVDPDIRMPAPQTGTMPVIPPPGSPGGDQTVRPK